MSAQSERIASVWTRMDGIKQPLLRRVERYAALTIPKLCLPSGHNPEATEQTHDYQSLGAAAVNHLNNRLLLALFRPGDPFFRTDPGKRTKADLAAVGMSPEDLSAILSAKEMEAVAVLDRRAIRPKLYQCGRHVIVTGNVLLELGKEVRTYGIKSFCVKRTAIGTVHTIIICERVKFDELEQSVQALIPSKQAESEVSFYRLIQLQPDGSYTMRQAVDEVELPAPHVGRWPADRLPFHVLTWDLADEHDYGTGLVEEYRGDFEALSAVSESLLDGTVLTTEMRWLVNPGGVTAVEDFRKSRNGDAIAGQKGDIDTISGGDPRAIEAAIRVIELFSQRIARGFMLQSAMTRNAERVTAEEVRALAMELETAFGGAYSQLGLAWQRPVALWCLKDVDMDIAGLDLEITVITGLDALTRNAQLEKLRAALGDLALFEQLPDGLKRRMRWSKIAEFVGQGRGVDLVPYLLSDEELKAATQQQIQDESAMAGGVSAGEAAGQATVEQGMTAQ